MPDEPELSFEQALTQIERIVVNLERGEPDLTTALTNYEKGVRMLTHCYRLLDQAEQSAALLTGVDEQGNPITAPFDTTATIERETSSGGSAPTRSTPRDSTRKTPEPTSRNEQQVRSHNDRTEASEPPF
jgi:exodeoxyribonuclease VII small subunit